MLAHILAIAVGLSSLILFLTAFSMSDIHQRDDFLWSGIGLFYALVLWFCASQITGSLLLGQVAAVTLVISFNWQTLKLRKAIANPDKAAEQNVFSFTELISGFFSRSSESSPQPSITEVLEEETEVEESTKAKENSASTAIEEETTEVEPSAKESPSTTEEIDVSTTESQDSLESPPVSKETEVDTTSEQETILTEEIIVPTVEEEEELVETTEPNLAEEVISVEETKEVEAADETSLEFNFESQVEEIHEEKPIDVESIDSEPKENSRSSIDDFLAELDNNIDKPAKDK